MNSNIRFFLFLAGALFLFRIVPHPPNFTPVIAATVFAACAGQRFWETMAVVLLAMFVSDLFLGLHAGMLWVYASLALVFVTSRYMSLLASTLIGPTVFFVSSNFAVWLSGWYPMTLEGLIACYVAAIPFYATSLTATVFYVILFKIMQRYLAVAQQDRASDF